MSLEDHHLPDNADDQVREALGVAQVPQTPPHVRGRHYGTSALAGSIAGQHLEEGRALTDLVGPDFDPVALQPDRRHPVVRIVGADIAEGQTMEIREDGRVYPVDEDAGDLADQLVDVAETAAAADQVEQALDDADPAPDYDFAEAVAGMANRRLQAAGLALEVVEACAGCGCTNRRACILDNPRSIGGGMHVNTCHWIATAPGQPPRCSKCGPTAQALEEHPATLMGIRVHRDDTIPAGEMQLRDPATGEVLMRITNIEQPTAEEASRAQALLLVDEGDTHPLPYAAAETMTAEREHDDETAPEAWARRRP